MKRITIFQDGLPPVAIDDSDDQAIDQYTRQLSKLLENNNISILHASSSSMIIRPNKISSIVVTNLPSPTPSKQESQERQKQQLKEPKPKKSKSEEVVENTITD